MTLGGKRIRAEIEYLKRNGLPVYELYWEWVGGSGFLPDTYMPFIILEGHRCLLPFLGCGKIIRPKQKQDNAIGSIKICLSFLQAYDLFL